MEMPGIAAAVVHIYICCQCCCSTCTYTTKMMCCFLTATSTSVISNESLSVSGNKILQHQHSSTSTQGSCTPASSEHRFEAKPHMKQQICIGDACQFNCEDCMELHTLPTLKCLELSYNHTHTIICYNASHQYDTSECTWGFCSSRSRYSRSIRDSMRFFRS